MNTAFTIDAAAAVSGPDWMVDRRRAAAQRFVDAELPSAEEEVWRYSRIGDLDLSSFRPAAGDAPAADVDALVALASPEALVVVTVDGRLADQPTGSGAAAVAEPATAADSSVGTALESDADALVSLHDAFATPVEIRVPDGADGGHVVVIHQFPTEGVASMPRLVVDAGQGATVSVVEVFTSPDGVRNLSVPVTELIVGRDATLRHASVQVLGDLTWQLARVASTVGQNGTVTSGSAAFGGDYSRLRVDTVLAGRGAHGDLFAGYFGTGSQLLDFRTFQDHVAPDTTSNLLFKGALGEKGASVYTGLIKIRPDARGSQAFQANRNLKLSDDAWAESVPNLEIENNEVQCSHASTVGPVDPEQRFYLESRGVPTGRAERLIVKGVFDEVIDALPLAGFEPMVREHLDVDLEKSLP